MFYCPYLGREVPDDEGSLEHVLPGSIGGSDGLAIRVHRKTNNDLGTEVDAVAATVYVGHRLEYDLRGHSGREVEITYPATVKELEASARWTLSKATGRLELQPSVVREVASDGKTKVQIKGDPARAREIAANMRRAAEAKGHIVRVEESPVREIAQPRVTIEFKVDLVAFARFRAKVTLGFGHWFFGDQWSRDSGDAHRLRKVLWGRTLAEINAVGLEAGTRTQEDAGIVCEKFEHLFFVANLGSSSGLATFLFGGLGEVLKLTSTKVPEHFGVIVDVRDGSVRRLSHREMIYSGRYRP